MSKRFWTLPLALHSAFYSAHSESLKSKMYILPFSLLIFGIPFGVAAHNAVSVLFLWMILRIPRLPSTPSLRHKSVIMIPAAITLWVLGVTLLNGKNPEDKAYEYIFGYLPIFLLPLLAAQRIKITAEGLRSMRPLVLGLSVFMALIATSQFFWGWSLRFPGGGVDYRPFGFVSHPLTLAYTTLLIFPWALGWVFRQPKSWYGWVFLASIVAILFFGQSRACQVLAYCVVLWNIVWKVRGRFRLLFLSLMVTGTVAIVSTDNLISKRFSMLIAANNPDHMSHYPVDRLAFWHAHWKMIQERPLTGHGMHLRADYREPYYQAIGLENWLKNYEAHNQYLQLWANGGLIALLAFLLWLLALQRMFNHLPPHIRSPFSQSLCLFILGNIVQNAYYDSEVRNLIMVAIIAGLIYINGQEAGEDLARTKPNRE